MQPDELFSTQLYPLGDTAIVLQFGNSIHYEVHLKVRALAYYLEKNPFKGMIEYVPAFTSVTVYYDPWLLSEKGKVDPYEKVVSILLEITEQVPVSEAAQARRVEIPVCYGGEFGPDLSFVAEHNQLSIEEVIAVHTQPDYLVYMIGFAPGFPYLGGMSNRIAAPRKTTPRQKIPQGSVGIAGQQTGIYPIETPGGWQLIGRTPLLLFDPYRAEPALLRAGDTVRFVAITLEEYQERKEQQSGV